MSGQNLEARTDNSDALLGALTVFFGAFEGAFNAAGEFAPWRQTLFNLCLVGSQALVRATDPYRIRTTSGSTAEPFADSLAEAVHQLIPVNENEVLKGGLIGALEFGVGYAVAYGLTKAFMRY